MDAEFWDGMYRESERRWSGEPNGALVDEAAALTAGRALDVGCGEGADAIWLAWRGWKVTATDVSQVALDRAETAARDAGVEVTFLQADHAATPPEAGAFDLVSMCYFPLLRSAGPQAARGGLDAVAPGGLLLVVSHDLTHRPEHWHGPDPEEFLRPEEFAALLGEDWHVEVQETRPRRAPEGNPHADDIVLRARRRGARAR
jgi:SAM-dependent methyltransferase